MTYSTSYWLTDPWNIIKIHTCMYVQGKQSTRGMEIQFLTKVLPQYFKPGLHEVLAPVFKTYNIYFGISLLAGGWLEYLHSSE